MSCSSETVQRLLLEALDADATIADTLSLRINEVQPLDQQLVLGVLKRLASHEMVEYEPIEHHVWRLTDEGKMILACGSHEARVFNLVPPGPDGLELATIVEELGEHGRIGQSKAFKNKWLRLNGTTTVVRAVEQIQDETQQQLSTISLAGLHPSSTVLAELKKRKLIEFEKMHSYCVRKGPAFSLSMERLATDLTFEMVQSGAWSSAKFKQYNYKASGARIVGGNLHPLLKVREEFRQIFFEMGFTEMPTNRYVESSFWNFDALFQPQQHPARDSHDTFFLKTPATSRHLPQDLLDRTKTVHEEGGYGSIGYKCTWDEAEARKNILRTHTTAISSQMLFRLAQEPTFCPAKYFSIDRVYRNESLDATHLAEFHQIEGVVVDYNLTLGDLIGILAAFFRKLGMTRLRFKPAYNPYTEPSMEIFAHHEGLGKWIEVGNSGIFRPEMLRPMGFDENVTVIAWGLSLERPTMIKYKLSNIRDLVGHKMDLSIVQSNPVCRLEK